jgi:hypothetical protein
VAEAVSLALAVAKQRRAIGLALGRAAHLSLPIAER